MARLTEEFKMVLKPYQLEHAERLISILNCNVGASDTSPTGAGKTYSALYVASYLDLKPFVICPMSVRNKWSSLYGTHFGEDSDFIEPINLASLKSKNS